MLFSVNALKTIILNRSRSKLDIRVMQFNILFSLALDYIFSFDSMSETYKNKHCVLQINFRFLLSICDIY